jgi:hypothetical protein
MSDPNHVYLIAESELIEIECQLRDAKKRLQELEPDNYYYDMDFAKSEKILKEVRKSEIGEVWRNRLVIKRDVFVDAMMGKEIY